MDRSQRALQIWQILIGAAHNRQVLTYGIVGKLVGMPPIALSQPLGLIMEYCDENVLPPLTLLVVQTGGGKPGEGLTTVDNPDQDREKVFNFNWYERAPVEASDFEAFS